MSAWINLKPGRYYSAIWWRHHDGRIGSQGDCLVALWRDPGGPWHVMHRLRWYRDAKPHHRADKHEGCEYLTEAQIRRTCREMIDRLPFSGETQEIDLRTADPDAIMARLAREPWIHVESKGSA
jgi:hypothetical protein